VSVYAKHPAIFLVLILVIAGSFVYFFNLNNPLFWDDNDWIVNNNSVHTVSWDAVKFWFSHDVLAGVGLQSNYYRPLLFFTFALNYIISGLKPLSYHLFSNYMHIANAVLVFLLLKRVDPFADSRFSEWESHSLGTPSTLVAFLTAFIFIVHPLQTEAVSYISGRGDLLVALFMLLALLFFIKAETRDDKWASRNKILSIVFLAFALLSRETAIIFPFLALSLYVSFLSRDRMLRAIKNGLIKTWPYFAAVFVYGVLRLTSLNFVNTLNFYSESNLYSENLHVRFFTFLPILWGYLKLLFVPAGLHMERNPMIYSSVFQWPVWPVLLVLVALVFWIRNLYKNKSETWRVWFFGATWFMIALGPVSGITPINALMYEHWLYLPMVGFWLIVSFCLVKLFNYLKAKSLTTYYILPTTLLIYLCFFGYQSIQRNILWGNAAEFYKDILRYEPASIRINNNLGNLYYDAEDLDQAEYYYRKATEGSAFAQPYFNLGSILQSKGDIAGAIKLYEQAISVDPNFFYPYQNLAVIYAQRGNFEKAAVNLETLKILVPNNPRVYYNSALLYMTLNNKQAALEDIRKGLEYSSFDPETGRLLLELRARIQK